MLYILPHYSGTKENKNGEEHVPFLAFVEDYNKHIGFVARYNVEKNCFSGTTY